MHTIENVEICTVGMDWPASTGTATITFEDVADAIKAANEDPHIQVPRGRLGHVSDLNAGQPRWDAFAAISDAEPAFGRFINLRSTNDGAVLVGDAIDVPDWITPSTFPSRSMEALADVVTPGGKRYSMVVTAVSWLGVYLPAVQDLEDLTTLIANGPAALAASEEPPVPSKPEPTAASVSISVIRDRFNYEWTSDNTTDQDTYWWWARDVRIDPNEVIVDDDQGGLWSVPFTTDGKDTVTFGDPVKVVEVFEPVALAAAAPVAAAARTVASFTRPAKPDRPTPAAASADVPTTKKEPTNMDTHVKDLLVAQGIDPDKATEEQIAAATLLAPEPTTPEADPVAEANPETDPVDEDETPADPVAEQKDRELVAATARIAALEKDAQDRRDAEDKTRRDALAASWVSEGRIDPADHDHYRGLLEINEPGTVKLASSLAAGRVPVLKGKGTVAATATQGEDALLAATLKRHGVAVPTEA